MKPDPYHVSVAKQVAILTKLNLAVSITRRGVRFTPVKPWYARKK
jgi:hypothetical protein